MTLRSCLLLVLLCLTALPVWGQEIEGNILVNGGFDNTPDPVTARGGEKLGGGATLLKIPVGSKVIVGWTVVRGTIYLAGDGSSKYHSVILSDRGAIAQTIKTIPGNEYILRFGMFASSDPPPVKDVRVAMGDTSQVFVLNGADPSTRTAQYMQHFVAKKAQTTIEFSTSLNDTGHHAPSIYYISVVPYDPLKAALERVYSDGYTARSHKDFSTAFSMLTPDYQYVGRDGKALDLSAYQASIRNARPPEGYSGVTTFEVRSVDSAKGSKNAEVTFVERYSYSKLGKDHQVHPIVLVTMRTDSWVQSATGWKLSRSHETGYEIYVNQKLSPTIP